MRPTLLVLVLFTASVGRADCPIGQVEVKRFHLLGGGTTKECRGALSGRNQTQIPDSPPAKDGGK